uniref:J domain-containing protein n=1 Tax=Parastrongyloides trichosuri TaxID=131310 RepID=A0A0N4ZPJ4_PARTI
MGRAKVEYDEVGNTFLYAVLAFYALMLIPITYFLWPKASKKTVVKHVENECECEECIEKRKRKEATKPKDGKGNLYRIIALIILWIFLAILIQKTSDLEVVHEEYDPYTILGLDQGAEASVIRKKYRELTKTHHPDRGGDAEAFDKIAKAYQALTDDEARANWEKYGNPDGPKAAVYGIALPSWVVSDQYGYIFLALYIIGFMIILPLLVSYWWKNAQKYSSLKVLVETTKIYYHYIAKTPKMEFLRVVMIIGGSAEFNKEENPEVEMRESDQVDIPRLMKDLKNLNEMNKEVPLCSPYSVKARALIHAHLTRLELWSDSLKSDLALILKKAPMLANEFVKCATQIYFYYGPEKGPSLDTFEHATKFTAYICQALWPKNNPLLQLPYFEDLHINNLRKNKVFNIHDFVEMSEKKRRTCLSNLTDEEYGNIIKVLCQMPKLEIEAHVEVEDEDDAHIITTGSLVTISINIKRHALMDNEKRLQEIEYEKMMSERTDKTENEEKPITTSTKKPWEKNKKKVGKKKKVIKKAPKIRKEGESSENKQDDESSGSDEEETNENVSESESDADSDDEEYWKRVKKNKPIFDADDFETVPVHCPKYPDDKYEWWYIYMYDKKSRLLVAPVDIIKTLRDEEKKEIKFMAGPKGNYEYSVLIRSDSYVDCEFSTDLKIQVKEPEVVTTPKVDYGVEEEEGEHGGSDTENDYTETDDSDSDD